MNALILMDLQNDFLPNGALAVKEGNRILPIVNDLLDMPFDNIIATKDWHPRNHGSFAATHGRQPGEVIVLNGLDQILWPVHCVQSTIGAEFSNNWNFQKVKTVILKGTDPTIDSYSAFFDNGHLKSTMLHEYLQERGVHTLYIAGLATDYCVKYSVLDALQLGYQVYVIADACRAVNLHEGDEGRAFKEMELAGARVVSTQRGLWKG